MKLNLYTSNSSIRFSINIIFVFILLIIGDRLISFNMKFLYEKYRPALAANVLNAIDYKSDILILGSSRAAHHYIPLIIEKETGYRTYNIGQDASNSIIDLSKFKIFINHYKPKLLIYDISAITFQNKPISPLYPLYSYKVVKDIIDQQSPYNGIIFSLFKSYRYNSIYLSLLKKINNPGNPLHGYIPLKGYIKNFPYINLTINIIPIEDKSKIKSFKDIISLCKINNIHLILINSPRLNYAQLKIPTVLKKFLYPEIGYFDINFIDYPEFKNIKLFKDKSHLNNEGATLFTKHVISLIKKKFINAKSNIVLSDSRMGTELLKYSLR